MTTKVCVPHCQTAFILNSIEKEIKSTQADKEEYVMMTKENLKEEPSTNQSYLPKLTLSIVIKNETNKQTIWDLMYDERPAL